MTSQLVVNPIACSGHGACAELLPERVTLDEWGYPLVDERPVSGSLHRQAARAVRDCPALALILAKPSAALSAAHAEETQRFLRTAVERTQA
jgi:ferredoxin